MQSMSYAMLLGIVAAFGLLATALHRSLAAAHRIDAALYSMPF